MTLKIYFDHLKPFSSENISGLERVTGLYFISLSTSQIAYPFKNSQLIYIGMSERTSNSIANRLKGHFEGISGNSGLANYRQSQPLRFTYINFESLKSFWNKPIEDLESLFIQDFVKKYGVYPICNNKSGFPDFHESDSNIEIDWKHFERNQHE